LVGNGKEAFLKSQIGKLTEADKQIAFDLDTAALK
jgi:hypothetical protein